jgi:hypothetical protein
MGLALKTGGVPLLRQPLSGRYLWLDERQICLEGDAATPRFPAGPSVRHRRVSVKLKSLQNRAATTTCSRHPAFLIAEEEMNLRNITFCLIGVAGAIAPAAINADTPGRHPAYLRARSDLRAAQFLLRVREEPNVTRNLVQADREVEAAIAEIDSCLRGRPKRF